MYPFIVTFIALRIATVNPKFYHGKAYGVQYSSVVRYVHSLPFFGIIMVIKFSPFEQF